MSVTGATTSYDTFRRWTVRAWPRFGYQVRCDTGLEQWCSGREEVWVCSPAVARFDQPCLPQPAVSTCFRTHLPNVGLLGWLLVGTAKRALMVALAFAQRRAAVWPGG